ncbi:MAG: hypothetical protein IJM46_14120 [Oscillospiraceae bacterium]|nr:hypothetical protein [Oscillospiraceae bacterium]
MTDTADFIRYYHGRILGEMNGVFLVHYGNDEAVYYGVGSIVHNAKSGTETPSLRSEDAANRFWADRIKNLQAHPETITEFVNPPYAGDLTPLPLDETNFAALMQHIKQENADWKVLTVFSDFLIAKRTQQIQNDRYAIVTYREPARFEGGPPLWDQTISKEQAERFSRNLSGMYAYYQNLKAEEEARRRLAAAQREQEMREHPERFSRKPIPKRKLRRMKKRLKYEHPDT